MEPLKRALIEALGSGVTGEARRLFHGRGQVYPGLEHISLDQYGPVMLLTLFQPEDEALLTWLCQQARASGVFDAFAIQHRYRSGAPTQWCFGESLEAFVVSEAGLRYEVQLGRSQNSGLFLDMACGREWVRAQAAGRRVLNLFSYTCSFSVAALAGGAEAVVNLDMNRRALRRGRKNHDLNDLPAERVRFLDHDLFRSWGKLKRLGPYSLVIVDPPSFQRGSFIATKDYARVLRRLPELLSDDAELMLCLNDPTLGSVFLQEAVAEHCPQARFVERLPTPAVFAERYPERGLKILRFRYFTSSQ